jgi:hypothetical protein
MSAAPDHGHDLSRAEGTGLDLLDDLLLDDDLLLLHDGGRHDADLLHRQ